VFESRLYLEHLYICLVIHGWFEWQVARRVTAHWSWRLWSSVVNWQTNEAKEWAADFGYTCLLIKIFLVFKRSNSVRRETLFHCKRLLDVAVILLAVMFRTVRFSLRRVSVCARSFLCRAPITVIMCAHVANRERLNGFSWNFILGSFTKVCGRVQILVQIWQRTALYMRSYMRFCCNEWVRNRIREI
jgi:hypothetical protein